VIVTIKNGVSKLVLFDGTKKWNRDACVMTRLAEAR
jgi:hypothetical protein